MAAQKQNPVTVVVLILVIAVALAFVIKAAMPKRYPRPNVDWTCEACGETFIAPAQSESRVCPKCGGEAVRTYYYYCSVHDNIFEAYRSKPNPAVSMGEGDMPPDVPPEEMTLYKMPGGEWTSEFPEEITCPKGNSDPSTLEYCPPTSERRQGK